MSEDERLVSIPTLKEEGNALYKAGDHEAASKKYSEALGRLEQLMLRYSIFCQCVEKFYCSHSHSCCRTSIICMLVIYYRVTWHIDNLAINRCTSKRLMSCTAAQNMI